ncbi:MAG: hypothetical protein ACREDF_09585 [Thermoplasmata archaeon]
MLAYSAGLFDGEGCVLIQRTQGSTFSLHVRVTSTDYAVVEWMKKNFYGFVGIQPPNRNVKNCRPCWYWNIQSRAASVFLAKITPFLVIKKEQADLAIEFQSRIGAPGVNRLTPEEITTRETYKRRLVELKLGCSAETKTGLFDPPYVSGLLDGEGTILVYKTNGCYQLSVRIVNTDLPVLERMKSLFGGNIGSKIEKVSKRTRPCWTWDIQGPRAAELLVELYPHLLVKREQARLAMEFQDRKRALQKEGALKEEKMKLGEEYKLKISALNRRPSASVLARS